MARIIRWPCCAINGSMQTTPLRERTERSDHASFNEFSSRRYACLCGAGPRQLLRSRTHAKACALLHFPADPVDGKALSQQLLSIGNPCGQTPRKRALARASCAPDAATAESRAGPAEQKANQRPGADHGAPWSSAHGPSPWLAELCPAIPQAPRDIQQTDTYVDLAEGADLCVPNRRAQRLPGCRRAFLAPTLPHRRRPEYLARCGTPRHPDERINHQCLAYNGVNGRSVGYFRREQADWTPYTVKARSPATTPTHWPAPPKHLGFGGCFLP